MWRRTNGRGPSLSGLVVSELCCCCYAVSVKPQLIPFRMDAMSANVDSSCEREKREEKREREREREREKEEKVGEERRGCWEGGRRKFPIILEIP